MIRVLCFAAMALLSCVAGQAQYYYNDLIRAEWLQDRMKSYKAAGVRSVNIISYDETGSLIEDFKSGIQLSNQYKDWHSVTESPWEGKTVTIHQFNAAGQLIQSVDSAESSKQVTYYQYEGALLTRITSKAYSRGQLLMEEIHEWSYSGENVHSMKKSRQGDDITTVEFVRDEQGRIAEEKIRKGTLLQETYYYYYDQQGNLTDIVRYNSRADKMLPDFIFEYSSNGQLTSMLITSSDKSDYQQWRYSYNQQGLKTEDICFGKNKRIVGRMEYVYK